MARRRNGWSQALRALWKPPSDEARQPWEKIIKAQVTKAPWEDIKGVPHTETPTKTWNSLHECATLHLLQVFRHDAGKALKYYITIKKPNRFRFAVFVRVEQLNSYLETSPCLYYSPANQATKKVLPLMTLTLRLIYCACVQPSGKPSMTSQRIPLRSVLGPTIGPREYREQ
eukprot:CCRYP_015194-RA/>CCRYP_015194-RA protein AED:0.45 eAED:0.45 QI:0/-1/0/1/-1/1/1/0/171